MTTPTKQPSRTLPGSAASQTQSSNPIGTPGIAGSKDNAALLAWVKTQYSQMRTARTNVQRQWYLNMAFYFGKQNVAFMNSSATTTGYQLAIPPAPPWRVRLVVNRIRPIVRTEIAKIVSQKPRFTVVPSSTDDVDIIAARTGEKIFDSIYQSKNLSRVMRRAAWWQVICGTAFIKCYWDPNGLDIASNQKGDLCIEQVTPFHLFVPDLKQEDLEGQAYVLHASTKSVDAVRRMYPSIDPNSITANVKSTDDLLNDVALNILGGKANAQDQVLCLEMWIKPGGHPKFPQGGLISIVADQVAQVVYEYPYAHNQYPFMKLEQVPAGRFYAESILTDLVPLQREYNRTRSQIVESKNRMAKPQLLAARGSIDASKITTEPGQVIYYTPGMSPPTPLAMQNLPSYVMESVTMLQQDMDDISGQHDISRGQNPSQVTAATALTFLQEQDDTMLSDSIESLEEAVGKLGSQVLSHVEQYWTTARVVKTTGRDAEFDATTFMGTDLRGNTDLRVEAGSALPTSKAAKQAFIMDLIKLGAIPVQDGLQVLDVGGIDKVYEDYLVDVRQAQRENLRMSQGVTTDTTEQQLGEQQPPDPTTGILQPPSVIDPGGQQVYAVNTWDNHSVHITIHNKFRKGQEFELLSPEVKAVFETHVSMHKAMLQQQPVLQPGQAQDPYAVTTADYNASSPMQPPPPPQQPMGQPPVGASQINTAGQLGMGGGQPAPGSIIGS